MFEYFGITALTGVGRIINQNLQMDKSIDEQQIISQSRPGFFNALQQQAENSLTSPGLKYCSYILMGLDTREITNRLALSQKVSAWPGTGLNKNLN
ncbi:hypothetical protein DIU31_018085 [Mucilaginibacter rubeus]|uniref:Uncharacterized protein n=1 Tax=Mucilaginibacter rubeus TaxID=2027860 RepID=A0AAE6MJ57_9SPHI|nr:MULTISPECIES: hypothetical protein [Mucilaginibacter]QEM05328.1 hypothetical protein DIU31_018085 [Mucilaginibacter rubeus]QEM17918.1 hypothetical protein DIU38_018265 [Mucilaginibacter gossypii]QTE45549.1 hypothetical protein J3L19_09415 [Mucilaginibacter rubeus]QTE52146.1 hypothetical protein J3L21_09395 [Mucilaginibacter rubeus]QTE57234.1 hypothetical protein J3L23_01070 [Mucilaginibacter rubeus]